MQARLHGKKQTCSGASRKGTEIGVLFRGTDGLPDSLYIVGLRIAAVSAEQFHTRILPNNAMALS